MDFMNRLFIGKSDEHVHRQFVRFGKGLYDYRALINFARGKQNKVSGSFEYTNDFVLFLATILPTVQLSGVILSKDPITGFGPSAKKSGIYQTEINKEVTSQQIRDILGKCYNILVDVSAPGVELKSKRKLPKPGKSGEGKVDNKFCVLVIDEKYVPKAMEFFFTYVSPNTKRVKTRYAIKVEDIIAPESEKDFEKVRLMAKRKGTITRISEVDKKEEKKEIEFCV